MELLTIFGLGLIFILLGLCGILSAYLMLEKSRFKTYGKTKVALLRLEYYAQQSRTPEKDKAFDIELQKVEIKYGLREEETS